MADFSDEWDEINEKFNDLTDLNLGTYPTPSNISKSTMTVYFYNNISINWTTQNVDCIPIDNDPNCITRWKILSKLLLGKLTKKNENKKTEIKNPYYKRIIAVKGLGINKGNIKKKIKPRKNNRVQGDFYNQVTIRISPYQDEHIVCVKICNNGTFHMTGVQDNEHGKLAAFYIIKILKNLSKNLDDNIESPLEYKYFDKIKVTKPQIALINTNFYTHFPINRQELDKILQELGYYSNYENSTYPGVNIKYVSNIECNHTEHKKNKKGKFLNCDCETITILTFQSGNVIITGAKTMNQINDAYKFINNVFKENFNKIVEKSWRVTCVSLGCLYNTIPKNIIYTTDGDDLIILDNDDFDNLKNVKINALDN
jgi:hypothetical protein